MIFPPLLMRLILERAYPVERLELTGHVRFSLGKPGVHIALQFSDLDFHFAEGFLQVFLGGQVLPFGNRPAAVLAFPSLAPASSGAS